jgi:hypothetical protein
LIEERRAAEQRRWAFFFAGIALLSIIAGLIARRLLHNRKTIHGKTANAVAAVQWQLVADLAPVVALRMAQANPLRRGANVPSVEWSLVNAEPLATVRPASSAVAGVAP